jgi:2-polyprenyl-3-methyl-5-hydroxy-6-metoxy-1,4-benzoquinol methylase
MSEQLLKSREDAPEVPERFDPATMHGEIIEAEHLARYHWVSLLARGRRVLDAGCGTGYGSALLAEAGASEVIGMDRASAVLDSARPAMPGVVVLEEGDVTALSYESDRFDLVVCFEVIEHLDDPGRALDEFRRVLSPKGVLAVSSPNRDVYPPGNPHHVHEYTPAELEQELSKRFACVRLERQHTWITSGVLDDIRFSVGDDGDLGTAVSIRKLEADEPGAELYTVALASQQELPASTATLELAPPVELRKWDALWHEQSRVLEEQAGLLADHERLFADEAAVRGQLGREIAQLREQLLSAESELARVPALDAQLRELVQVNDQLAQRALAFDELSAIADRYTVVVQSTSWKLTRPLRRVVSLLRRLTS